MPICLSEKKTRKRTNQVLEKVCTGGFPPSSINHSSFSCMILPPCMLCRKTRTPIKCLGSRWSFQQRKGQKGQHASRAESCDNPCSPFPLLLLVTPNVFQWLEGAVQAYVLQQLKCCQACAFQVALWWEGREAFPIHTAAGALTNPSSARYVHLFVSPCPPLL